MTPHLKDPELLLALRHPSVPLILRGKRTGRYADSPLVEARSLRPCLLNGQGKLHCFV